MHEQKEETDELLERTRIHTERLKIAEERARIVQKHIEAENQRLAAEQAERDEKQRLKELAAKKIDPPSPIQQQQPPPAIQPSAPKASATTQPTPQHQKPALPAAVNGAATAKPSLFTPPAATVSKPAIAPVVPKPAPAPVKQDPAKERALQIHKNLKELRRSINTVLVSRNAAIKNKVGDMRREMRKCVGQLSFDKDNNNKIVSFFWSLLPLGIPAANSATSTRR